MPLRAVWQLCKQGSDIRLCRFTTQRHKLTSEALRDNLRRSNQRRLSCNRVLRSRNKFAFSFIWLLVSVARTLLRYSLGPLLRRMRNKTFGPHLSKFSSADFPFGFRKSLSVSYIRGFLSCSVRGVSVSSSLKILLLWRPSCGHGFSQRRLSFRLQ